MKKSTVFKCSGFALLAVALAGAFVIVFHPYISSRIVLRDEVQGHRILLHNAKDDRACNCFSPLISYFTITNITSDGATFIWDCSEASTYQVNYGLTSSKGTLFPSQTPAVSYTLHAIALTGLQSNTLYHVGPSSLCLSGCMQHMDPGQRKQWLMVNTNENDWTFTTLPGTGGTLTIKGAFLTAAGKGIKDVTVTLSGDATAAVTAPDSGIYQFADLTSNKNYTVTPTLTGYTFIPASRSYTAVRTDRGAQNFVGSLKTAALSESSPAGIAECKVAKITAKDVTITWKTYVPSTSLIEYGLTKNYGMKSGLNTEMGLHHDIQLFELREATTYHCRAVSYAEGSLGTVFRSPDCTFTTPAFEERIADKDNFYNEPNPCSDITMFIFFLYQSVKSMDVDIFSLSGKPVASLACPGSTLGEGWNKVAWNLMDNRGKLLKNGLYVYTMKIKTANNEVELKSSGLRVAR